MAYLLTQFPRVQDGLIIAGGMLREADMTLGRKHPIVIPEGEHGDALLGYLHASTEHQGRTITTGWIRNEGYIAAYGNSTVRRIIDKCITCRRLRAAPMTQKMADLPSQRLEKTPPFWHCGIDVFGPFHISYGRHTKTSPGTKKIWILLFTCLYSRGIHLETLDSMDTASFRMAFNRFQDIRGRCILEERCRFKFYGRKE